MPRDNVHGEHEFAEDFSNLMDAVRSRVDGLVVVWLKEGRGGEHAECFVSVGGDKRFMSTIALRRHAIDALQRELADRMLLEKPQGSG